jgi:hypothetical protein
MTVAYVSRGSVASRSGVGVGLEAPGASGAWTPTRAWGRAGNGDNGGSLVAVLRRSGDAKEEREVVRDGRAGRRWSERPDDGGRLSRGGT